MLIEGLGSLVWPMCLPLPSFMSERDITVPSTENFFYSGKPIQVDQDWHMTPSLLAGLGSNPSEGNKVGNITLGLSCPVKLLVLSTQIAIEPHMATENLKYWLV